MPLTVTMMDENGLRSTAAYLVRVGDDSGVLTAPQQCRHPPSHSGAPLQPNWSHTDELQMPLSHCSHSRAPLQPYWSDTVGWGNQASVHPSQSGAPLQPYWSHTDERTEPLSPTSVSQVICVCFKESCAKETEEIRVGRRRSGYIICDSKHE